MFRAFMRRTANTATRGGLIQGLVRGFGGALLAGFAWKLGADAYDAAKKQWKRPRRTGRTRR